MKLVPSDSTIREFSRYLPDEVAYQVAAQKADAEAESEEEDYGSDYDQEEDPEDIGEELAEESTAAETESARTDIRKDSFNFFAASEETKEEEPQEPVSEYTDLDDCKCGPNVEEVSESDSDYDE